MIKCLSVGLFLFIVLDTGTFQLENSGPSVPGDFLELILCLCSIFSLISLSGTPVWMMDFHDWPSNFPIYFSPFIPLSYFWEDLLQGFYLVFHLCNQIFNLIALFFFVFGIFPLVSPYSGFRDTKCFILLKILLMSLEVFPFFCVFSVPSKNFFSVCLVWPMFS